jgi:hypothetical protein
MQRRSFSRLASRRRGRPDRSSQQTCFVRTSAPADVNLIAQIPSVHSHLVSRPRHSRETTDGNHDPPIRAAGPRRAAYRSSAHIAGVRKSLCRAVGVVIATTSLTEWSMWDIRLAASLAVVMCSDSTKQVRDLSKRPKVVIALRRSSAIGHLLASLAANKHHSYTGLARFDMDQCRGCRLSSPPRGPLDCLKPVRSHAYVKSPKDSI